MCDPCRRGGVERVRHVVRQAELQVRPRRDRAVRRGVCHCCSSIVLNWAPVSVVVQRLLTNGSTPFASAVVTTPSGRVEQLGPQAARVDDADLARRRRFSGASVSRSALATRSPSVDSLARSSRRGRSAGPRSRSAPYVPPVKAVVMSAVTEPTGTEPTRSRRPAPPSTIVLTCATRGYVATSCAANAASFCAGVAGDRRDQARDVLLGVRDDLAAGRVERQHDLADELAVAARSAGSAGSCRARRGPAPPTRTAGGCGR